MTNYLEELRSNDKILVIVAMVAGMLGLAAMVGFVGQGNVRHVEIFWAETVEQTIVFEEINGETQVRGIKGVQTDANPTLLSRTSFAYVLTVINNGTTFHRLYIDEFNVQTELLKPGQQDTITIYPEKEGEFALYDKRENLVQVGKLKVVTVVASDEFQGIWKDLI
jgi:hypothetical protein